MIKTLEISLATLEPPVVGVPVVAAGVLASGYYTDPGSDIQYYYDAGNDQWYHVQSGYLYPLAISWQPSPSAKVDLISGDSLRFRLTTRYMGPPVTRTFYAALGNNKTSGSFEEWSGYTASKEISFPGCDSPTLFTDRYIDIIIPAGEPLWGHHGEDGAAYCKVMNGITLTEGKNCTPYYYNVCHIVAVEGEFTEFGIASFEKV